MMFEPVKLIAAAAAISVGAGLLGVGTLGPEVPGGMTPAVAGTWVAAPAERQQAAGSSEEPATETTETAPMSGEPAFVRVVGVEVCEPVTEATVDAEMGGIEHDRGGVERCVLEVGDPRLAGEWTVTSHADCFAVDGGGGTAAQDCLLWGMAVLEDPAAGWTCDLTGLSDPYNPGTDEMLGICPGTGANEGWTFVYRRTMTEVAPFGQGNVVRGMIYEGDPPPPE